MPLRQRRRKGAVSMEEVLRLQAELAVQEELDCNMAAPTMSSRGSICV
jgi:predicted NUDIX family phosphoesterase